jgi:DinB family protein
MDDDRTLRRELVRLLEGVDAHMTFDEAVADFPSEAINAKAPNVSYTPWHLLEHLRITQRDILDYVRQEGYVELDWPSDYWPSEDTTVDREQFDATIAAFQADNAAFREIVADTSADLLAVIPGTPGHTILREARVAADHNAYHVGEFAIMRQIMGTWPANRND